MLDEGRRIEVEAGEGPAVAEAAGLRFISDDMQGITRRTRGKSFRYELPSGAVLKDHAELARIRKLAIPPAWTDVWICPSANGHIQATGRDARGRKQYRYHADWSEVRDAAKYDRLLAFARLLPQIRKTVAEHLAERRLTRNKVLATVVYLLDTTLIRVGNRAYARENKSYGLTTLQDRHVAFAGNGVRFKFRGKTGREWHLKISDRRIANIVRSCQELPGQHLFQYESEAGEACPISSTDVNAYLREISGTAITAKDFRTWAGTVLAAATLADCDRPDGEVATRRALRAAIETVADRLGNTQPICRKCYVHPGIIDCYLDGTLGESLGERLKRQSRRTSGLRPQEAATLALLQARLDAAAGNPSAPRASIHAER